MSFLWLRRTGGVVRVKPPFAFFGSAGIDACVAHFRRLPKPVSGDGGRAMSDVTLFLSCLPPPTLYAVSVNYSVWVGGAGVATVNWREKRRRLVT
jgi:hypothetical protein